MNFSENGTICLNCFSYSARKLTMQWRLFITLFDVCTLPMWQTIAHRLVESGLRTWMGISVV